MPTAPCTYCRGTGRTEIEETVDVRVPAGAEDGTRIRVGTDGETGDVAGRSDDVYDVLRVLPDRDPRIVRYAAAAVLVLAVTLFAVLLLFPDLLV